MRFALCEIHVCTLRDERLDSGSISRPRCTHEIGHAEMVLPVNILPRDCTDAATSRLKTASCAQYEGTARTNPSSRMVIMELILQLCTELKQ
jgi:hypothetical protein